MPKTTCHNATEYARKWRKANPLKVAATAKRSRIKNREKINARQKIWLENNREKHKCKSKEWYQNNKLKVKNCYYQRVFGITLEGYTTLLSQQNFSCAICGSKEPGASLKSGKGYKNFAVDHNHLTGKIRGLLCRGCNVGIGNLKDNPELLEKAAAYIRNSN